MQRGQAGLADAKAEIVGRKLPYLVQFAKLDFGSPKSGNFCEKICS